MAQTASRMFSGVASPRASTWAFRVAVGEVGGGPLAEAQLDGRDDGAAAQLVLEDAVAVCETALLAVECQVLAALCVVQVYAMDYAGGLGAVGPDVLHGRCAHRARYEREVLGAPQPALDTPCHHAVPVGGRVGAYRNRVGILADDLDCVGRGLYERALEAAGEEYVVSSAQHIPHVGRAAAEDGVEILRTVELDDAPRRLLDVETVEPQQWGFGCFAYHCRLLFVLLFVNLTQQLGDGRLQLLVASLDNGLGRVGNLDVGLQLLVLEV